MSSTGSKRPTSTSSAGSSASPRRGCSAKSRTSTSTAGCASGWRSGWLRCSTRRTGSTNSPTRPTRCWGLNGPAGPTDALLRWVIQRFSLQFSDEVIPIITGQVIGQSVNAHDPSADINEIRSLIGPGKPPLLLGMISWKNGFGAHTIVAYDWEPGPNDTTIVYVYNPNVPYTLGEESQWGTHTDREAGKSVLVVRNSDSHWEFAELGWEGADNNLVIFTHAELPILNGKSPHLPERLRRGGDRCLRRLRRRRHPGQRRLAATSFSKGRARRSRRIGPPASPRSPPSQAAPARCSCVATDTSKAGDPDRDGSAREGRRGDGAGAARDPRRASRPTSVRPGRPRHRRRPRRIDRLQPRRDHPVRRHPGLGARRRGQVLGGEAVGFGAAGRFPDHLLEGRRRHGLLRARPRPSRSTTRVRPAALSLTLSGLGADGLPVAVRLPKAHLVRGERLSAAPTNWRKLGSAPIRVTTRVHGRTSTQPGQGTPARQELCRRPRGEALRIASLPGPAAEAPAEGRRGFTRGRCPPKRKGRRRDRSPPASAAARWRSRA